METFSMVEYKNSPLGVVYAASILIYDKSIVVAGGAGCDLPRAREDLALSRKAHECERSDPTPRW